MSEESRSVFEERAGILKALGHPSRLIMVDELSRGERCVCELTERVRADMSTVSKHLSLLKDAGVVDCEKRRVPCVLNFFSCIEAVREENERRAAMAGKDR